MRHIISVLLENEPGALSRVVGLFSQRNYNIDSLTVAPTEDQSLSRLTVTTSGDDARIEQITIKCNSSTPCFTAKSNLLRGLYVFAHECTPKCIFHSRTNFFFITNELNA